MEKTKIILDCDPGHDDAVAITLAANSDKIDLLGITVVAGNQTLEKTQINARNCASGSVWMCRCMRAADSRWCVKKMIAGDIHGETGLDGPVFPPLTKRIRERACSQFHHQNPDGVRRRYHDGDNRSDDQSGDGDADGTGDYSEDQTDRPDGRRVYQW